MQSSSDGELGSSGGQGRDTFGIRFKRKEKQPVAAGLQVSCRRAASMTSVLSRDVRAGLEHLCSYENVVRLSACIVRAKGEGAVLCIRRVSVALTAIWPVFRAADVTALDKKVRFVLRDYEDYKEPPQSLFEEEESVTVQGAAPDYLFRK